MTGRRMVVAGVVFALGAIVGLAVAPRVATTPIIRVVRAGSWPVGLALDARTRRVFVINRVTRTMPAVVSVLDARTGTLLQTGPLEGEAVAVAEQTGHVFVSDSGDGAVHMLDARNGRSLRVTEVGLQTVDAPLAVDTRTDHLFVANPSPICCDAGSVSMLDAATGRLLRSLTVGNDPIAVAADGRIGHLFVVNENNVTARSTGAVSMLDARSGRVLHTAPVGLWPSAVAVDEHAERVFVLNSGAGTVTVLDARSGAVVRTSHVGPIPDDVAVDERRGRVFVTNAGHLDNHGYYLGGGSVSILDAATGRSLGTVVTAFSPADVALDPRTGDALVTTRRDAGDTSPDGQLLVLDGRLARVRAVPLRSPSDILVSERTSRAFVVDDEVVAQAGDAWRWLPDWLRGHIPLLPAPPSARDLPASVTVLDLSRLTSAAR